MQQDKFKNVDFKYDNTFFQFRPQDIQLRQLENVADFKYDNIIFKFQSNNIQMRLFGPKFSEILFFRKTFQSDKFEDADFKYYNITVKFQSQI